MVKMPTDRTVRQPARGFCRNPECRDDSDQEFQFRVENDHFACPKCGANKGPMVGVLSLTHLLIRNPHGPIIGQSGLRYALGCDLKRAYLATLTNQESATDDVTIANCPGCLERARSLGLNEKTWQFTPLQAENTPQGTHQPTDEQLHDENQYESVGTVEIVSPPDPDAT